MRLAMALLLAAGLLLTGCESSRNGPGMMDGLKFDGGAGIPKVINIGPVVNFSPSALPLTLSTGNYCLSFKLRDPSLTTDDEVFIGPHSSVTVDSPTNINLNVGWMYWRGPRLVGRTRRFAPGPQVGGMTNATYRVILHVDPFATSARHFVFYAADSGFKAVDSKNVILDAVGEFAEVIEPTPNNPVPIFKLLSDPVNDNQKRFYNFANKTAMDANFPHHVPPFP